MAIFKCKMCGGSLEIQADMEVCECEFCGTRQTLPRLSDNKKEGMYDRANHFRRNNDFDKAMSMYEQILNEDETDAEAYWSIVLCRYGIEYVEDPVSHNRIPTVNRAQYTSIFADEDYKAALKYASTTQKVIFEEEAKTIDEIQKGILAISQKEQPFDVFICYKESDANGKRTQDSVIANDIYHQLSKEGFKVFFAAITLEDKLGKAYEPYIFAALNSAKVMIVLGTKPEYFNAPWVKNEWSRYLKIIKNDTSKILIPAYRDMDPYDMPEEFSFLQAQDMGKIGFMNDIIHGIKKVIISSKSQNDDSETNRNNKEIMHSSSGVDSLMKRAFFFLEEGNWTNAMIYCEKVLDTDPEFADAYLAKFMAETQIKKREDIVGTDVKNVNNKNFLNAIHFADGNKKEELVGYKTIIQQKCYEKWAPMADKIENAEDAHKLVSIFELITEYSGAQEILDKCREKFEYYEKEKKYYIAIEQKEHAMSELDYRKCYVAFKELAGFKDADVLAEECLGLEKSIIDNDKGCSICRENDGVRPFIPNNSKVLCCENCFSRLSLIQQNIGKDTPIVKNSIVFLKSELAFMGNQAAINRVKDIIRKYEESVGLREAKNDEEEKKNQAIITQEEQRKQEELERQKQDELKLEVLRKNAKYEYDIQVVMDTPEGGTDVDMIKYVISKFSVQGWKLHTINLSGTSGTIGQTIIIFERRIKEQD